MDLGHWVYPGDININNWFGFIYRIVDLDSSQHYIGKKQFWTIKRKIIKGRKNKKIIKSESDWKNYTSSSEYVNSAILAKGKDKFVFLIESLHPTKGALHYAEVETQINEDVLRAKLPTGDRKFYNKMVANMKFLPPEETSEETKAKIKKTTKEIWQNTENHYFNKMSDEEKDIWREKYFLGNNNTSKRNKTPEEYEQWKKDHCVGENNPMFGRTGELHPNYGKERPQEVRDKISKKNKGKFTGIKNPRYGKSPFEYFPDEELHAHKKHLSKIMSGENNPMFGIPCTYKMTEEEKQTWKNNISAATKGKKKSNETRLNMSNSMKGVKKRVVKCPHCGKEGGSNNMYRYHFDNCKLIQSDLAE